MNPVSEGSQNLHHLRAEHLNEVQKSSVGDLAKIALMGAAVGAGVGLAVGTPIASGTSLSTGLLTLSLHKFCGDPAKASLNNSKKIAMRTFIAVELIFGAAGAVIGATSCVLGKVTWNYFKSK